MWRQKYFNNSKRCYFSQIYCITLIFLTSTDSEECVTKSSRTISSYDAIRIANKNETKQTIHHRNIKRSLLINPTLNNQEVSIFVHSTLRLVLIMSFIVKPKW